MGADNCWAAWVISRAIGSDAGLSGCLPIERGAVDR